MFRRFPMFVAVKTDHKYQFNVINFMPLKKRRLAPCLSTAMNFNLR
jgi:hypothetical protein